MSACKTPLNTVGRHMTKTSDLFNLKILTSNVTKFALNTYPVPSQHSAQPSYYKKCVYTDYPKAC